MSVEESAARFIRDRQREGKMLDPQEIRNFLNDQGVLVSAADFRLLVNSPW